MEVIKQRPSRGRITARPRGWKEVMPGEAAGCARHLCAQRMRQIHLAAASQDLGFVATGQRVPLLPLPLPVVSTATFTSPSRSRSTSTSKSRSTSSGPNDGRGPDSRLANYFRHLVSSRVFRKVDTAIFDAMVRWMRRRHPGKGLSWLRKRYIRSSGDRNCIITASPRRGDGSENHSDLFRAASLPIRRHLKVQAAATAFDPDYQDYFRQRRQLRKRVNAATAHARLRRPASRSPRQPQPQPGHLTVAHGKA